MGVFKIIYVLLFCSYNCEGHFIFTNYNNRKSPTFPSLNFQTFFEYFKPLYRIRHLSHSSTINNIIETYTTKPTKVTDTNKQTIPFKQRVYRLLPKIKNVMKSLTGKIENSQGMIKKPIKGHGTYEQYRSRDFCLKLTPKQIKKVLKQLRTIFTKVPKGNANKTKQGINETKESEVDAIDFTNNRDNTSSEHYASNKTSLDKIKKKTGFIDKEEAKSIFGNFMGNNHFANIFIFYPTKNNSSLIVGLKDNTINAFTKNPVEILTRNPTNQLFDKITENKNEESLATMDVDHDLYWNNYVEFPDNKSYNTDVKTEVTVITDTTVENQITESTSESLPEEPYDKKGDESTVASSTVANEVIGSFLLNQKVVKDEYEDDENVDNKESERNVDPIKGNDIDSKAVPTNLINKLTQRPSENLTDGINDTKGDKSTVGSSTVANNVTEGSSEDLTVVSDDEKVPPKNYQSTVASSTVANEVTISSSENLTMEPDDENGYESTMTLTTVANEGIESFSENLPVESDIKKDYESTVAPSMVANEVTESFFENLTMESDDDKDYESTVALSTVANEVTENLSEKFTVKPNDEKDYESTVAPSTVAIVVTKSSYENLTIEPDDEKDYELTVAPSTVANEVTESFSDNFTMEPDDSEKFIEKLKKVSGETGEEIHDQAKDKLNDTIEELNIEATVVSEQSTEVTDTMSVTSTIEYNGVTNMEVPITTESYVKVNSYTEFKSNGPSDNTTGSLSTAVGENTTQNIDNKNGNVYSLTNPTDDDYIEIEYTYNIFL